MTNKEFIEKLQQLPLDAEVVIASIASDHNYYSSPDFIAYSLLSPTGIKADERMAIKIYA